MVIGSSNTDMTVKTAKLPVPGETVLGGEFIMGAGGKGANQAVPRAMYPVSLNNCSVVGGTRGMLVSRRQRSVSPLSHNSLYSAKGSRSI